MTSLRVWWVRNPPNKPLYIPVNDIHEARGALKALAESDLRDSSVAGNAGGLEVLESAHHEWEEWTDSEGRGINDHLERGDE